MKKKERVKSNLLFNSIINNGKKKSNKYFTIFFSENKTEKTLFGITAPKRVGNAVIRNRLKRQTRELIDKTKILFKKNRNYIIIVKDECLKACYDNKITALKDLIGEINEK